MTADDAILIALGSINLDLQVRAERWPGPGETLPVRDLLRTGGGKAANRAFLARRLGVRACLIGHVGDDDFGEEVLRGPREVGIELAHVTRVAGQATALAMIVVRDDGDKTILLAANANDAWSEGDAEAVAQVVAAAPAGSVLTVDLEVPTAVVLAAVRAARSFGLGVVTAPGQRYHPAVLAQATATLLEMFPGRFWLAIGSGERLNEGITGEPWPAKDQRNARLRECADVMRALWAGETVTHRGLVRVEAAKLYTRPRERPQLFGAAVTAETARWLASWADELITVAQADHAHARVIEAFRAGGGAGKPVHLKVQLAFAGSEAAAVRGAWEQWRTNVFASDVLAELRTPGQFEAAAAFVTPDDVRAHVRVSADPARHVEWLARDAELGLDLVSLHHVGGDQERFIDEFAARVLPELRQA